VGDFEVSLGAPEPLDDGPDHVDWRASEVHLEFEESVFRDVGRHAAEDTTLECGGVLLGTVEGDTGAIAVTAALRADGASRRADSLRFTHEVIAEIHHQREIHFPDLHIVGWYHTHPGYGIFLSADDLFMHRNFFDAPYQVAYVIDPIRRHHGLFVWQDGDVVRTGRFSRRTTAPTPAATSTEEDGSEPSPPAPVDEVTVRVGGAAGRFTQRTWALVAAAAVVLFVVGFGIGRSSDDSGSERAQAVSTTADPRVGGSRPSTTIAGSAPSPTGSPETGGVASPTLGDATVIVVAGSVEPPTGAKARYLRAVSMANGLGVDRQAVVTAPAIEADGPVLCSGSGALTQDSDVARQAQELADAVLASQQPTTGVTWTGCEDAGLGAYRADVVVGLP
jgi:proteasome lid subunit RPN8/RPN11